LLIILRPKTPTPWNWDDGLTAPFPFAADGTALSFMWNSDDGNGNDDDDRTAHITGSPRDSIAGPGALSQLLVAASSHHAASWW
jgi:hypothetical protein